MSVLTAKPRPRLGARRLSALEPRWPAALALGVMLGAGGLFARAYELVPSEPSTGRFLIWVALAIVVVAVYAVSQRAQLSARSALVVCVGLGAVLYLPKLFRAPDAFTFFDELQHVRATEELKDGASLWVDNPLNPLVEHYPGLHVATAGVAKALGLSVFTAGNMVLLLARVVMLVSLFALYRRITSGTRVALLAVMVYTANPAYLFFDAQFSYESLALPLGTVVLALAFVGADWETRARRLSFVGAVVAALALVVTHHVSSYAIAGVLLLFAACVAVREPDNRALADRLALLGAITAAAAAAWLNLAIRTVDYLGSGAGDTIQSIPDFLGGKQGARAPFSGSPFPVPLYERVTSLLGVVLVGVAFLVGVLLVRRDVAKRGVWLACALLGVLFFVSLPLQLIQESAATPIAPRIWELSFIGLAPIAAVALDRLGGRGGRFRVAAAAALIVMVIGGAIIRSGDNIRLPGPYIPSSGPRAATPDVIDAARWLQRTYGPHRTVMGDSTVAGVFGAYARSQPASYQNFGYRPWLVFFGRHLSRTGRRELDRSHTEFVAVDRRIAGARPYGGFYFSSEEPGLDRPALPAAFLRKFDESPFFERVYDARNMAIYRYTGAKS